MQFSHEMHLRTRLGLPGRDLVQQLGVGEHRAAHRDEVGATVGENPLGAFGVVDAADGDHRHVDHLLDGGGGTDVECVAVVGGVDHAR